jgi:hypothetical protein
MLVRTLRESLLRMHSLIQTTRASVMFYLTVQSIYMRAMIIPWLRCAQLETIQYTCDQQPLTSTTTYSSLACSHFTYPTLKIAAHQVQLAQNIVSNGLSLELNVWNDILIKKNQQVQTLCTSSQYCWVHEDSNRLPPEFIIDGRPNL